MRLAGKLKFVDVPDERKVHVMAIPRIGGVGMVLGTVASVFTWMNVGHDIGVFLAGVLVIAAFGVWDDRANLNYKFKFAGQLLAVLIVVLPGCVLIDKLSFIGGESLPHFVSIPLTVFFLLGMTNAMNLSDGLDGLAAGVSLLSLACVMVLATMAKAGDLVLMGLAILGATMGFLRYNTHPALVFMGDTGSQFLGFSLGVLAIWLTQKSNTALAPELPLLILGLPIIDTLVVMTQRIVRGQSPFKPDKNHFHHKLLDLGFDHYEAVLTIYVVQALFVVSAYLLRYETDATVLGSYGVLFALITLVGPIAKSTGWRRRVLLPGQMSFLAREIYLFREKAWLEKIPYELAGCLIPTFLISGSLLAVDISADIGYLALATALVSLGFRIFKLPVRGLVERLVVYISAILVVYLVETSPILVLAGCHDWVKYYFLGLAALIALGVRYSGGDYFSVTPSDFLVMFILLAVAYLPVFQQFNYAKLAIESAILLYGTEFVFRKRGPASSIVWGGAMIGFVAVGARVLL